VTAGAVAAARLQLLLGEVAGAESTLAAGGARTHPRARVGAGVVSALAAAAAGDHEQALHRLEEALLAAAPHALRRPFLAEADELRDLLEQRVERGSAATTFVVDLLARLSGSPLVDLTGRGALLDPLTQREQTILHYLASTLSNAEIANELYLSVKTIKTHQRGVYRKLAAAGRRDAVRRARALRLL
jgi:LuxR family maltose regulon positive regulatory protein